MNNQIILLIGVILVALWLFKFNKKKATKTSSNTSGWLIGPRINGQNYSINMPDRPTPQGDGWYIDLPKDVCQVDYVQWFDAPSSLLGKRQISMQYSVTGGEFKAVDHSDLPATVGISFQRKGDDWSGTGAKQSYRWYTRKLPSLKAGEYTLTVPLDSASWGDVQGKSNEESFNGSLGDIDNISIVFGSGRGAGHGVYATGPSRFTMLKLEIT